MRIPVTDKSVMLRPEDTLAVLKWRLQEMSPINRWHAVLDRYVSYVAARVNGLGGDADAHPALARRCSPTTTTTTSAWGLSRVHGQGGRRDV